ncbi:DnaJ domain-containing protein [Theileria equi strain WA]|uniref:DnaJ domain-containing protein n=1 Tax=Theileria equi strain WA TaxID=1537102 RepID=L0B346_THEEQ|nr:DnaJ domain-containing protein [Theileria equi strain WA]AFZ81534.1 DnaJ domain-containing protein [Theileria equi strain WA]|eukprot:XP_004831200.1 DnaJ domain-containing protein [Theileria equi strain WA]
MYNNAKLIIILCILSLVDVDCKDYYRLLGIRKNASEKEIEKAFRKKAKLLHPDVAPGKDKEFAEVANAYEVLKDPEKRKIYDRYGEDGLKQEGHQEHYNPRDSYFTFNDFDFDDIFQNIHFNHGGFGGRSQEFIQKHNFEGTIVEEIGSKEYNNSIRNVRVLNLYYFFTDNSRKCSSVFKGFVETITKFKGAINVFAINCNKHPSLCNKGAQSVPYLIAYTHGNKDPHVFNGENFALSLEIWLHKIIPSELVEIATHKQLSDFVDNQTITHVVVIVKKTLFLTILKSLSVYVKSKIKIGYIKASNAQLTKKIRLFKNTETATLYHISNSETMDGPSIEINSNNFADVLLWLNLKQNEFKKNLLGVYKELTKKAFDSGECGTSDNQFCFIFVKYGHKNENAIHNLFPSIAKRFGQDPLKIRYIDAQSQTDFVTAFNLPRLCTSVKMCTKFLVYRAKRGRFRIMDEELTVGNIERFIDNVITNSVVVDKTLNHKPAIVDKFAHNEF